MPCGADTTANTLLNSLLQGKSFELPEIDLSDDKFEIPDSTGDLYGPITKIGIADLTSREVDGTGVFDALMSTISVHLKAEYTANRITGQQYTEAYIAGVGAALQTAASFLMGKDQAYWQAVLAQQQARTAELGVVTARLQLETTKAQLMAARMQSYTAEAEYGLTKMKIATEDQQYCVLKKQESLITEQIEVQRAQTLDTRVDGQVISGSVGKQKDLYTQQITSYERDAEVKAAKMFVDAWITQKTIDEGLTAPVGFTNASLDTILTKLKVNNALN
jgi:hypothetical protein